MKTIGIKLADGSFYPILTEGMPDKKELNLTTVRDNQTTVQVDLYRSENNSMDDAEYVDTLQITHLPKRPNGELDIALDIMIDETNHLSAQIHDSETGLQDDLTVTLVTRTEEERKADEEPDAAPTKTKGLGLLGAAMLAKASEEKEIKKLDTKTEEKLADELFGKPDASAEKRRKPKKTKEEAAEKKPAKKIQKTEIQVPESTPIEMPEFNEEPVIDDEPVTEENLNEPVFENSSSDIISDSDILSDATLDESNVEIPDFNFTDDNNSVSDDFKSEPLPEIDDTIREDNTDFSDIDFDLPDFPENQSEPAMTGDTDYSSPADFSDLYDNSSSTFSDDFSDDLSSGLNSTESNDYNFDSSFSDDEYDEDSGKTRVPVLICVICAIICMLAVCLLLFIIPSKFNIFTGKNSSETQVTERPVEQAETPAIEETKKTEPVPEPVAPKAKENEVIIAPVAEVVVPEPVRPKQEAKQDIRYKIKWGDTLWDIADAYYKNPWRYKKIARYNKIRNPDYIVAGTYITIPAE